MNSQKQTYTFLFSMLGFLESKFGRNLTKSNSWPSFPTSKEGLIRPKSATLVVTKSILILMVSP